MAGWGKKIHLWECRKCNHQWKGSPYSNKPVCPGCGSGDVSLVKEISLPKGRRNKYELIGDILSVVEGGATKTDVVYRARTNFDQAQKYLNELLEFGLVSGGGSNPAKYELTKLGKDYLERLKSLRLF